MGLLDKMKHGFKEFFKGYSCEDCDFKIKGSGVEVTYQIISVGPLKDGFQKVKYSFKFVCPKCGKQQERTYSVSLRPGDNPDYYARRWIENNF